MAKARINSEEYAFSNAVELFKVIERLSDNLKEAFILDLKTGYPVNVSRERITVIQYLKNCQELKETAWIFTSKQELQSIF